MPVPPAPRRRVTTALTLAACAAVALTGALTTSAGTAAAAPTAPPNTLTPGQTLASGASLDDPSSGQRLTMQTGGALVLTYLPAARTLWSTTTKVPGSRLVFRKGGDLQVVDPKGAVLWRSGTSGSGLSLSFSTCGQLAIAQQWVSNPCAVGGGGALVGRRVSADGRTTATQQHDGNLVVTTTAGGLGTRVLWASRTGGAVTAVLQRDQNFVLYRAGAAVWSTRTGRSGCGACQLPDLAMQNDGNLVLYSPVPTPSHPVAVWSTRTTAASWGDPTLGISSTALGPVQLGMTVAQARAAAVVPLAESSGCFLYGSTTRTFPSRFFVYDPRTGRVVAVGSGNSQPFTDRTAAGIVAGSTGDDVLRAYGSAARSYTDGYGTFNVVVRSADGNELRFEVFGGHRTDVVSLVQGGQPATVDRVELCG